MDPMKPTDDANDGATEDAEKAQGRLRRSRALSDLAQGQASVQPSIDTHAHVTARTAVNPLRAPRFGKITLSITLVGILLVAGIALYELLPRPVPSLPPIPDALTLDVSRANAVCPTTLFWSPNNLLVAVVASDRGVTCSDSQMRPVILIYDARTGRLAHIIHPDSVPNAHQLSVDSIELVGWTLDSANILLQGPLASQDGKTGLLIVPLSGGTSRLFQGPAIGTNSQVVWNMRTGQAASVTSVWLPPALTYRWTADGRIIAAQPFPASSTAGATGGTSMSADRSIIPYWQSGIIMPLLPIDSTGAIAESSPPVANSYTSGISSWSPDGRYFTSSLLLAGLFPLPHSTPSLDARDCILQALGPSCPPFLPYPNTALAHVDALTQAGTTTHPDPNDPSFSRQIWSPSAVAWRPDGAVLAALLPGDQANGGMAHVSLFDASNAKLIRSLVAQPPNEGSSTLTPLVVYDPPLFWSPSGQQLAFVDFGAGRITIWGASQVAAAA